MARQVDITMVSDTILAAMIGVVGSLLTTSFVGVVAYLGKDKIDSFSQRLDNLEKKIENSEQKRKDEHDVVLMWISRMSKQMEDEGIEVERPKRLDETVEINEE